MMVDIFLPADRLYKVLDVRNQEWWSTRKGKNLWKRKNHARAAITNQLQNWGPFSVPKRYIIIEYKLVMTAKEEFEVDEEDS